MDTLNWTILSIPSIILASSIHEFAHAYAAYKLGDPTPKMMDRLTINPLKHIDPIGAISMILFRFGWSKPVPINEGYFKRPVLGTAITAFAGPFSNFLIAGICALINKIPNLPLFIQIFIYVFVIVNLSLAIFNLIPIPPLDGHKVVRAILPKRLRASWEGLEKYSWILIILILFPFSGFVSQYIVNTLNFFLQLLGF
jgi:Zn-dependent protease